MNCEVWIITQPHSNKRLHFYPNHEVVELLGLIYFTEGQ